MRARDAAREVIALVLTTRQREGPATVRGGPGTADIRRNLEDRVMQILLRAAAGERERAAKVAERMHGPHALTPGQVGHKIACTNIAAAIRQLPEEE